jgi:hypothetical protein
MSLENKLQPERRKRVEAYCMAYPLESQQKYALKVLDWCDNGGSSNGETQPEFKEFNLRWTAASDVFEEVQHLHDSMTRMFQ